MTTDETLLWKGSPSQWTNFGTYVFSVLFLAAFIFAYIHFALPPLALTALALPLLVILIRWIATRCQVYEITTERIRVTTGLLSRRTTELELYRVRDYTLIEPFWLRLVGRGHIVLQTADRTSPQFTIKAVPSAASLKDQIRANTERLRQKRGVRDLEIDTPDAPELT